MELLEIQKKEIAALKEAAISCIMKQIVSSVINKSVVCVTFKYPRKNKTDRSSYMFFLDLYRDDLCTLFCIRDWSENIIIKEKRYTPDLHWTFALEMYLEENIEKIIKASRCFELKGDY